MQARALIMRTAGTNCDYETQFALESVGAAADRIHVNRLSAHPQIFAEYDLLVIPGGFSYGDDLGAGTVLGNELLTRLREPLDKFVDDGKIIIGICNGFQVLVKTGLLPGLEKWTRQATLTINDSHKFEDRWVHLKAAHNRTEIVKEGDLLYLPIAHAEGKLVFENDEVFGDLRSNGQVIFRYCDSNGQPGGYPENPNGSIDHIAGICDLTGRVLGMMPHPERYCNPYQHPAWTREKHQEEPNGKLIFRRAVSLL